MTALNISNWNNDTGLMDGFLNDSAAHVTKHIARKILFIPSLPIFLVVVLGLPGNVLVLAVYVAQMTTSTKVYMFSLAVADTSVCICGIILTSVKIDHKVMVVVLYFIDLALILSIYMLAFVSVERLVAVCRPYAFNLSARRAKIALALITVAASLSAGILTFARIHRYRKLGRVCPMLVTLISVLIMIVCYMLMAVKLLKNLKASRKIGGVPGGVQSVAPGPSTVSHSAVGKGVVVVGGNKGPTKQAKTYKGVLLLFIITLIFIGCWFPQWLAYAGFSVSAGLRRIFVLNSAVNPFIYCVASAMFRKDVKQFYHRTLVPMCH